MSSLSALLSGRSNVLIAVVFLSFLSAVVLFATKASVETKSSENNVAVVKIKNEEESIHLPLPKLYGNLSCPFEWSKYSCIHQGQKDLGNISYQLASKEWSLMGYEDYNYNTSSTKLQNKVLFVGDSTVRQIFIAMACHFWHAQQLEDYSVDWKEQWPCHGTRNCISGGNHSGFPSAKLKLRSGLELFFGGGYGKLVKWKEQEWDQSKPLSFPSPHFKGDDGSVPLLTSKDIVFYNIGLHVDKERIEKYYPALKTLASEIFLAKKGNLSNTTTTIAHDNVPTFIYMTTVTQHFPTRSGKWGEKTLKSLLKRGTAPNQCVPNITINPRQQEELSLVGLKEGVTVDYLFDPLDKAMGAYHVGGNDCTHNCMPGVSDLMAMRLWKKLKTILANMQ